MQQCICGNDQAGEEGEADRRVNFDLSADEKKGVPLCRILFKPTKNTSVRALLPI